jgi:hypothetical protein
MDDLRSLVRPVVTLILVVSVILFVGMDKQIPDRLYDLALMVVSFWFGTRVTKQ